MWPRFFAVVLVSLLATGCDSTTEPPAPAPPTVNDWRVIAVRGDQATPVPAVPPVTALRFVTVVGEDGYTNEPLVAEIALTDDAEAEGKSLQLLPPNTLVHWHLPAEAGRLFGETTAVDDSLHVINRYAPGTRAGEYTAEAGRLVGTEIVIDATWQLVVLPGPAARLDVPASPMVAWLGDTANIHILADAWDQYGNSIPRDSIRWDPEGPAYTSDVERWDTLTVAAGDLVREVEVAWMRQIGPGWTYSWACAGGASGGEALDSVVITMVVDSIQVEPASRWPESAVTWRAFGHRTSSWYYRDRDPYITSPNIDYIVFGQSPGEIRSDGYGAIPAVGNPPTHWSATEDEACASIGATLMRHSLLPPTA